MRRSCARSATRATSSRRGASSISIEPGLDHLQRDIPAEVMAKSIWRGTLKGRRKDGSSFPAACTITALRDATGRITHFVGVERDMTEDLALRDQLVHSERLSAIGELIAGVAHEINNPLADDHRLHRADARRARGRQQDRPRARAQGSDARRPDRPQPAGVRAPRRLGPRADRPQRSGARHRRAARLSPAADQHHARAEVRAAPACPSRSTARRSARSSSTCSSTPSTRSPPRQRAARSPSKRPAAAPCRRSKSPTAAPASSPSCGDGSSNRSSRRGKSGRARALASRSRSGLPPPTVACSRSSTLPQGRASGSRCRPMPTRPPRPRASLALASARWSSTMMRRFGS